MENTEEMLRDREKWKDVVVAAMDNGPKWFIRPLRRKRRRKYKNKFHGIFCLKSKD